VKETLRGGCCQSLKLKWDIELEKGMTDSSDQITEPRLRSHVSKYQKHAITQAGVVIRLNGALLSASPGQGQEAEYTAIESSSAALGPCLESDVL
jgi:hypothetical protein